MFLLGSRRMCRSVFQLAPVERRGLLLDWRFADGVGVGPEAVAAASK